MIVMGDFIMLEWVYSIRNTGLDALLTRVTHAGSLFFILPVSGLMGIGLFLFNRLKELQLLSVSLFHLFAGYRASIPLHQDQRI